ncbi:hypothetical protein DSO57_1006281 [Entomophthora muscae]|uniref:Uncharacterized protein n=1 Tax=Entomophthora muscae TaxID=34485 RepID=A0ACC2SKL7_9FUNG|nr:hypothetical protein DSO57_1006281 [Entomophthora muscae]
MAPKARFPSFEAATQAKAKADEQRRFISLSTEQKSWAVIAKVTTILKSSPNLKLDLAVLDSLVLRSAGYREFLPNGTTDLLRRWAPKLDNFITISYSFFDYTLEAKLVDINYDISHLWSTQGFHWHPQHTFAVAFQGCSLEESTQTLEQFDFGDSPSMPVNPYQTSDSLAHFLNVTHLPIKADFVGVQAKRTPGEASQGVGDRPYNDDIPWLGEQREGCSCWVSHQFNGLTTKGVG